MCCGLNWTWELISNSWSCFRVYVEYPNLLSLVKCVDFILWEVPYPFLSSKSYNQFWWVLIEKYSRSFSKVHWIYVQRCVTLFCPSLPSILTKFSGTVSQDVSCTYLLWKYQWWNWIKADQKKWVKEGRQMCHDYGEFPRHQCTFEYVFLVNLRKMLIEISNSGKKITHSKDIWTMNIPMLFKI